MNGTTVEVVDSSWIEALGGLSWKYIRRMPPLFCACAPDAAPSAKAPASTAASTRMFFLRCDCREDGATCRLFPARLLPLLRRAKERKATGCSSVRHPAA